MLFKDNEPVILDVRLPILGSRNIECNDIVMKPPYKYQFRIGGRFDVDVNDEIWRNVNFPMIKNGKAETRRMWQHELFLVEK